MCPLPPYTTGQFDIRLLSESNKVALSGPSSSSQLILPSVQLKGILHHKGPLFTSSPVHIESATQSVQRLYL